MTSSKKEIDERVCSDAKKFEELFYHAMDTRREIVAKMYTENACMVWNGEPLMHRDKIDEWLTQKVPKTGHTITYCDAQRVLADYCQGREAMVVQCGGNVRLANKCSQFTQTFLLVKEAQEGNGQTTAKWMIASDKFRSVD